MLVVALALSAGEAHGQPPAISSVSPQAVRPGQPTDVTIRGSNLAGAMRLWTSFPGEVRLAPDVDQNGQKNDVVVFRVSVPPDTPVGVEGIRVVTSRGVSPPRLLAVDDLASVSRNGSNSGPETAQEIGLPVAVDGAIGALSRHYYRFTVDAGQRLSMEVLARRLGSALDPMIRIMDMDGHELEYSDDEPGLSGDARVCYTFQNAGQYLLELRDIRYQGGGNYFYRLRVGDFPCVSVPYPMVAARGSKVSLRFAGPDVDGLAPVEMSVPTQPRTEWLNVAARRAGGSSSGFAVLAVTDADVFLETEPNNRPEQADRVTLGNQLNGLLQKPDDVDRFVFSAKKGQKFRFEGVTRRQGSSTDLVLRLLNEQGGQVAESDDSGMTDGVIEYTFPADGDYTLVARDLHRRGGSRYAYRILVAESRAGFGLTATADRLNVPAGGTAMVTVNVARRGYNGPIELEATGLPEGVSGVPTVIGSGQKSVVMTFSAEKKADPGAMSEVRIIGRARVGESDFQTSAGIADALRNAFAGMPWPPPSLLHSAAVAIAPPSEISLQAEPAEVVFGRDLSGSVKVTVDRQKGFDEAVALAVTPKKNGLPGGISASLRPIPKGKNEIEIGFSANNKAPLGEFSVALLATIKQGDKTVTQPVPGIRLKLAPPFELTAEAGDGKLSAGGQLKLNVTVKRNPALDGPIELSVANLPKGVTAEKTTIPAEKNNAELVLKAAEDASAGSVENLAVRGNATIGKAKLTAASPPLRLTVE